MTIYTIGRGVVLINGESRYGTRRHTVAQHIRDELSGTNLYIKTTHKHLPWVEIVESGFDVLKDTYVGQENRLIYASFGLRLSEYFGSNGDVLVIKNRVVVFVRNNENRATIVVDAEEHKDYMQICSQFKSLITMVGAKNAANLMESWL